ncbi:YopX family protein [Paenibacillus kribbensis]|uniref:YopX family protein n=1 Tax=Paenibacillus kribbensis TaxID=172713 RepID=UPI00398B3263
MYEGDILKWYDRPLSWYRNPDTTTCSQIIDVAVFSNGSFRTRKYSELLINLCGTKDFNFLERSEIEVIGNIYETPLEDTP